jgi:hypothetical protein
MPARDFFTSKRERICPNITTPGWIEAEKRKIFWRVDKATPSLQELRDMPIRDRVARIHGFSGLNA